MTNNPQVTVVYLMYVPYGIEAFDVFMQSYRQFSPGVEHELKIIFKDAPDGENVLQPFTECLLKYNVNYQPLYFKGGYDIDAYRFAANKLDSDYFYFLNTRSRILCKNWLVNSVTAIENNNFGVIASTSSNSSHYSGVFAKHKLAFEFSKSVNYNFRKYKLFIKALFYWRFLFPAFPNPHIRTNAFLIDKKLFLSLQYKPGKNKLAAYGFESGWNSFTRQLLKKGYEVPVMDKNGKIFMMQDWPLSKTFWNDLQEGLVVADNQTEFYANASEKQKKELTLSAWGN